MHARRLGRTGFVVGEVGVGCSGIGGDRFRDVEPADAQRALYYAIDHGVDFVDTALQYGDGLSERLVGDVVRELRARDRVVVATKVPPHDGAWPGRHDQKLERVFGAPWVQTCVERSLRHLRLDAIPLVQLHVWHDAWLDHAAWPELRGVMERMIREGKVLHWGISANNGGVDHAYAILDEPIVETIQVACSLFDRSAEARVLARAAERDVAVIARGVLCEGALAGGAGAGATYPRDDFRTTFFSDERMTKVAAILAHLAELVVVTPPAARSTDGAREILERSEHARDEVECRTVAELAIRWVLSHAGVAVAIPGMRARDHVDANLAIADGRPLSTALIERLADDRYRWRGEWYG
jgi:aryl-alcohol dehydrogenase-like predicted oxidoreductase